MLLELTGTVRFLIVNKNTELETIIVLVKSNIIAFEQTVDDLSRKGKNNIPTLIRKLVL